MRKGILIYGLQRSGTNFLEKLLSKNFRIKMPVQNKVRHHPIHKHFRLYDQKNHIPESKFLNALRFNSFDDYLKSLEINFEIKGVIIISKDPYSWLISYKNWGKKHNWPIVKHHYIEEYNFFYEKWMDFSQEDERILHIRYSDLLLNTHLTLNKISVKLELQNKFSTKVFGELNKVQKVKESGKFTSQKFKYYKNKEYMSSYSKESLKTTNSLINKIFIEKLCYGIIN